MPDLIGHAAPPVKQRPVPLSRQWLAARRVRITEGFTEQSVRRIAVMLQGNYLESSRNSRNRTETQVEALGLVFIRADQVKSVAHRYLLNSSFKLATVNFKTSSFIKYAFANARASQDKFYCDRTKLIERLDYMSEQGTEQVDISRIVAIEAGKSGVNTFTILNEDDFTTRRVTIVNDASPEVPIARADVPLYITGRSFGPMGNMS